MPQTSREVQDIIDRWFPNALTQDSLCCKVLHAKGWAEKSGMFYPPTPSYYGPREDYILLRYLVEEWDYAYQTSDILSEHRREPNAAVAKSHRNIVGED